ncbi:MAG: hypothetical protein AB7V25_15820 [Mangrovibacterium sp.]
MVPFPSTEKNRSLVDEKFREVFARIAGFLTQ